MEEMHASPMYGHAGTTKTKKQVQLFWWPNLLKDVTEYVKHCPSCQVKSSTQKPAGLLKPLPIPEHTWEVVTMDFIKTNNGHTALLVVVDKLSKMTHLIPTTVQVTGEKTARLYVNHVMKHHGLPKALVSDRDPRFTGRFMTALLEILKYQPMFIHCFPPSDGWTNRKDEQDPRGHVEAFRFTQS